MAMQLDAIVPFGRSLDEYRRLFALSSEDLGKRIVSIADGPASFNAEMVGRGGFVTSVDPLYAYDGVDIKRRFDVVVDSIIDQVRATPADWVWSYHRSPEHLRTSRRQALQGFLVDYDSGRRDGRYVAGELPRLEYPDSAFELALCSHFLFLYSAHLSYEFHKASVIEMLRVAAEVRIFPLLTLDLQGSPYLVPLASDIRALGYAADVEEVHMSSSGPDATCCGSVRCRYDEWLAVWAYAEPIVLIYTGRHR